jgi:uncharacterized YigZ family protein
LQTVTKPYISDYRVKGSKFLGYLYPATTQDEIDTLLESVKSEHPTASHHCYAYRLNPNELIEFEQDDGEPKGTAGLPILNSLRSAEMINCIIISVRYFGGTKLGKSGLIEAYGNSGRLCIQHAESRPIIPISRYRIVYDYPQQGIIDKLKNDFPLIEQNSVYLEKVELGIGCPTNVQKRFEKALESYTHLFDEFEKLDDSYHINQINE